MPTRDWNDEFANSAHIPGSDRLPQIWAAQAAAYRGNVPVEEDIAYGPGARHKLDLIRPDGPCKGLVVFVHGGFWQECSKSDWTDLAEGGRASGWAVALPGYTLAPEARISEMTREIGAAINRAAELVEGPIRITGHSAGGHLVSRMNCQDSPLRPEVLARVRHTVSISGLHDLRLLLATGMKDTLHLTDSEAVRESPALLRPAEGIRLTCWVGAAERPEFLRQSRLMAMIWDGLAHTRLVEEPGRNHFTVLDGLKRPDTPLMAELMSDPRPGKS